MFKSLFGGNKEEKELKQKLQQLETALANKELDKVIAEGEPLLDQVSDKQRKDLIQKLALANFHSNKYEEALSYFNQLCELDKDNSDFLFNVCTCSILNKQPEKGLQALDDAIALYQVKGKRENIPVSFMIFYAMCAFIDTKSYDLAYEQLDRLSLVYRQIGVTDNQFLHSRGYVPFSHLLEKMKIVMENRELTDAIAWLSDFATTLDEDGQIQIDSMIEDLKEEHDRQSDEDNV